MSYWWPRASDQQQQQQKMTYCSWSSIKFDHIRGYSCAANSMLRTCWIRLNKMTTFQCNTCKLANRYDGNANQMHRSRRTFYASLLMIFDNNCIFKQFGILFNRTYRIEWLFYFHLFYQDFFFFFLLLILFMNSFSLIQKKTVLCFSKIGLKGFDCSMFDVQCPCSMLCSFKFRVTDDEFKD